MIKLGFFHDAGERHDHWCSTSTIVLLQSTTLLASSEEHHTGFKRELSKQEEEQYAGKEGSLAAADILLWLKGKRSIYRV